MEIDLSKVTLRPFKPSDVDDVMLWAGDDQVTQKIGLETCGSAEEALTFVRDVCIPHPRHRSICIDDRSIWFISVFPGSDVHKCRAEMGYATAAKYWGRGITTKAVKIALSQVFKDLPDLIRLQAFAAVQNKASQRVLGKAGFLKDVMFRNEVCLSKGCSLL